MSVRDVWSGLGFTGGLVSSQPLERPLHIDALNHVGKGYAYLHHTCSTETYHLALHIASI